MNDRHNILAVSKLWAGIFSSLFVMAIAGDAAFAWSANSQQAVMQDKVERLEQAKLPERIASIEQKVANTDENVKDIKQEVRETNQKMDLLLRQSRSVP